MTDEQRRAVATRRANLAKLSAFLSGEKKGVEKPSPLFPGSFLAANRYTDSVIQTFYERTSVSKSITSPEFDPKAEWDKFIAPYVSRFGEPAKQNKAKKSRKGVGGRKESELTTAVKEVLAEAEAAGEVITKDDVFNRTWEKLYPGKDKAKRIKAFRKHKDDVRERLSRYAPHLLSPPNRPKKSK